jgi:signal transduction histidine kinase
LSPRRLLPPWRDGLQQAQVEAAGDRLRAVDDPQFVDHGGYVVAAADGPAQGHFGLQGMRERIAGLGGTFSVESRPGAGTAVTATVTSPAWDRQLEDA